MRSSFRWFLALPLLMTSALSAGEKPVITLRDMSDEELKCSGFELPETMSLHIKARGACGDASWSNSNSELFAYSWIINADTRDIVWKMDEEDRKGDDCVCDRNITMGAGRYEVYCTAPVFNQHTTFKNFSLDIDHRDKPLFKKYKEDGDGFFAFFFRWWSDDIESEWKKRSPGWGIEILADDAQVNAVRKFTPPLASPHVVLRKAELGENEVIRQGLKVLSPVDLHVYAIGEGVGGYGMADFGWIVDSETRKPVWKMTPQNVTPAGGAGKNKLFSGTITFPKGEYVLYFVTDDSHSSANWNASPPSDPLNYGITITARNGEDAKNVKLITYEEDTNVFVSMTRVGDNKSLRKGFTLKRDTRVRIYAFGERSNFRRHLADYAYIIEAKSRNKVWTMDVDNVQYAGGAPKNIYIDEVMTLPRGSYVVCYNTDDSHSYDDWNADPPFDPGHYGVTLMGVGSGFDKSAVSSYVEERDRNIVAQILRVGDNENRIESFSLPRTTRLRIYSIGEGQNRKMFDYGWIEDTNTGSVVWEMTYSMTTFAGGDRKNRMVNTTILLERGKYALHFRSDDSHSYDDWNVAPPEDQEYWGITLYKDSDLDGTPPPGPSAPGAPPDTPLPSKR